MKHPTGHGKSAADGIGGSIKNRVLEKVLMSPDTVMNNVEDIKKNIDTSIELFIHTKEDIKKIQDEMPKVGVLIGATKIHEIVFECDGKMRQKNLPNETSYRPVRIKIGRQIVRNREEVDPEAEVLQEGVGADILDDAILEPGRESLRVRRRRAAYAEVVDELADGTDGSDNSDLDDE